MSLPILVATNFDRNSNATKWGVRLAQALQVPLLLAHVVDPAEAELKTELFHKQLLDDVQVKLNHELQHFSAGESAGTLIEVGRRVETLLQMIADHRPQLLVIGKRTTTPQQTPFCQEILARSPCPVVQVPDGTI